MKDSPTGYVASDMLYKMLLPIQKVEATKTLNADRLLVNWNNKVESENNGIDKPWWPSPPRNVFKDKSGRVVRLNEEEYTRYVRDSGKAASDMIESWLGGNPKKIDNPSKSDIAFIQNALEKSREETRRKILKDRK